MRLQIWTCDSSPEQKFDWVDSTIRTRKGAKCLELPNRGTADGRPIRLRSYDGTDGQKWAVTK
jgi:hypothetical protein